MAARPVERRDAVHVLESAVALFLKNLLFTIVVPGTVAIYIPTTIVDAGAAATGGALLLAATLMALGGAIYGWCLWDFAVHGRGTPAPIDAPKKLVVRGLYRYTRNPMYVGVLTVILGWAVLFQSAAVAEYALIAAICFHLVVVVYEEPHLRRMFPEDYKEYTGRTPRWLPIPKARQKPDSR